jgi:quinone-modifying oxidoreductase subunit QmoB
MADQKIATYICSGCDIGAAVDVPALAKCATSECKAALAKTHACLCGDEGVALVRSDIAGESLTTVVLAACSFRAKQEAFQFPGTPVVRVNLREGVAWVLPHGEEDTQHLAEDYLRMGCEQARRTALPVPYAEGEFSKQLLVVGGGVAGMTAALEAARAGYGVTLVEKSAALGGFAARLHRAVPTVAPYRELEESPAAALAAEVRSTSAIEVLLGAELAGISGGPCKFEVTVLQGGAEKKLRAGAIVMAAGFAPYEGQRLGHLGYGQHADVVTSVDFEEMARAGKLLRPSDGKPVANVLFVQCAGSRDANHLAYCSSICCATSLKQAAYLRAFAPGGQAYVLYKDMRTPGQAEELYREAQRAGVVFVRGELRELARPNGRLTAHALDLSLAEEIAIEELDLVVLAVGQVPATLGEGERVEPLAGDAVQRPRILKLDYRQGPELPNLRHGYPDSHFICFPYETRRTGIYAAGSVRRAMGIAEARRDATGAALKAIQAVEAIARGEAVHPRAGDQSYPDFFMQRCTQCKRCTEECPFGAINEDAKANPLPNPTRCRRCGVCMGACPERIISFKNYSVDMIGSMIKMIEVPPEEDEKPCVVALVCENDAYPVLDRLAQARARLSPFVRFLPLRCMGSLNLVWVADALSKGIDGLLFFGCQHGEDYQCHFIKGSELCAQRLSKVQETLDRLVLEADRVRFEQISMNDVERVPAVIAEFMEKLEELGPNPYKGF